MIIYLFYICFYYQHNSRITWSNKNIHKNIDNNNLSTIITTITFITNTTIYISAIVITDDVIIIIIVIFIVLVIITVIIIIIKNIDITYYCLFFVNVWHIKIWLFSAVPNRYFFMCRKFLFLFSLLLCHAKL